MTPRLAHGHIWLSVDIPRCPVMRHVARQTLQACNGATGAGSMLSGITPLRLLP